MLSLVRRNIIIFFNLCFLFVIEQIRMPANLFWTMLSPVVIFVFVNINSFNNLKENKLLYYDNIYWFVSYISVSVAIFGFSLYIIGRRESGFLKVFVQGKKSKILFICSQMIASLIMSILYYLFFLTTSSLIVGVNPLEGIILTIIPFILLSLSFIFCGVVFVSVSSSFHFASSFFSIIFTFMMLFGVIDGKINSVFIKIINDVNPIIIGKSILEYGVVFDSVQLYFFMFFFMLSVYALFNIKVNPSRK